METTFISIHNLDETATILYSSDSIIDILGYTPDEVVNRSAWEFFPPEDLPYARDFQRKKVVMDKAAVLAYCKVKAKSGDYIGCEVCFSIVYDVMIVCTSVYKQGMSSDKRAQEAPLVRRMFTSSPQDPRYHMLTHLSQKFAKPAKQQEHEPRAALFLNRFTRTLSIMYATSGIEDIIGIPADNMRGRSFYYCIAENCLDDAVKCLEQAKGNGSIAYLRFWFRDPRQDDPPPAPDSDSDEEMTTDASVDDEEGGVHVRSSRGGTSASSNALSEDMEVDAGEGASHESTHSSNDSTHTPDTHEAIFGEERAAHSSASSAGQSPDRARNDPIELEAVISCASDGLVVCLRQARPMIPPPTHRPSRPVYENGLFAAPWANEPLLPAFENRAGAGFTPAFAPSLGPHAAAHPAPNAFAQDRNDFMNAIRDQAVFAWALTGINGSLADFSYGKPHGEALPANGVPIWESDWRQSGAKQGPTTAAAGSRSPQDGKYAANLFGDPGLNRGKGGRWSGSGGGGSLSGSSSSGTPRPT